MQPTANPADTRPGLPPAAPTGAHRRGPAHRRRRHSALRAAPGWGLLLRELRGARGALVRLLAWSAVEALPPLVSGLFVSAAVDQGFLAGRPGVGAAWLGGFGAAMGVRAYAARAGFPYLAAVVEPLRDSLVERVVRSALARPSADPAEVARLTEQVESVRQLTATLLRTLRGVGVTLVAALIGLALLAPAVLPLVLLPLAAGGALFVRLLRPMADRRGAAVLAEERLAAEAGRALHGLRDVQATGSGEEVARSLAEAARASAAASRSLGRASALRALVVALGGRLPVLAVLAAAPWLLARGALTAGELLGVATYLLQQLDPAVRTLAGTVGGWLLNLAVVLDRLAAATTPAPPAQEREQHDTPDAGGVPEPGEVRVIGVRHGHGGGAAPVLDGLDAVFRAGERVAVVGVSGAGKSTLAGVLAGVVAPTEGRVVVGGAQRVELLPQEAYVFPGTVRENLAWLAPGVTDRRLAGAVELLGAGALVERLGGLGGGLRDPGELSSGERQLIALVRTYVSPAAVVVLDEATCHLDAAAEERVERAFAARPGTLVVIAHRIGSALRADRVLLLDGGRGVLARHGDLQVLSPLYRELVGHWLGSTPRGTTGLAS